MIQVIKEIIQKNKQWLDNPESELSFLKMNTPASGTLPHAGKVLIFVFEKGKKTPTLCIKTTRTYEAGETIKKNYENLVTLSQFSNEAITTAKPLLLFDNKEVVLSFESVCPGTKFSSGITSVDTVLGAYILWQKDLKSSKVLFAPDLNTVTLQTISALGLPNESEEALIRKYDSLGEDSKFSLPELIQHGDMTPDNVLVDGAKVYLVDYDYVGLSKVPGFDIFHFLSKTVKQTGEFKSYCELYLHKYFDAIGGNVQNIDKLLFTYHMQESLRKGTGTKNGNEIVSDFESLIMK
ncbi:MAG TPA: hypothetical protein VK145_01890 [Candidatus Nanoarchaeia archaeon]|nr:hypothetical protein [Candidatus Nanoarchaeia archaeon]